MADIPGLIEGAHRGAGLGHEFLRHVERTHVLLHLIDVGTDHGPATPAQAYHTIRDELRQYSNVLAQKAELVVANKIDLTGGADSARELSQALGCEVLAVSTVTGDGLREMQERLWTLVTAARSKQMVAEKPGPALPEPPHRRNLS